MVLSTHFSKLMHRPRPPPPPSPILFPFTLREPPGHPIASLPLRNGLDLKVEGDEGEHEALEVLDEVVEEAEALGVRRILHLQHGRDLGAREGDVLQKCFLWPNVFEC